MAGGGAPKDVLDVEKLVAVQAERLDHAYVRRWLIEMVGDDERVATWDRVVRALPCGP